MSQDEQPPSLPLEASTPVPGALDHAWVVESIDQQYSFSINHSSLWLARVRCALCGFRAQFRAQDVPPCRPRGA